jgi:DNA polymerase-4
VSVGVAANRLVAKIASDLRKPDGLVVVPVGEEAEFLAPLKMERLWGVGASTRRQLAEFGVATIGDLAALPPDVLERRFGKHGRDLSLRARGIGETVVGGHDAAKSVSHEHTYDVDTSDWEILEQTLLALSENVAARLRSTNVLCATVSVKIRNTSFETITRQRTLPQPTDMGEVIFRAAVELTRREVRGQRIRLLGVAASGLAEERQMAMFEGTGSVTDDKRRRATEAADAVRNKFGSKAIRRARLLDANVHAPFERDPRRLPIVNPDRSDEE